MIRKVKRFLVFLIAALLTLLLLVFAFAGERARAEPNNILINTWALGIDNATGCPGDISSGWTHSPTVSLSRCPKNPAPTAPTDDGAAFKNGPVSGGGVPGVETTSSQTFALSFAESHTLTFSALIVCVRCDYLIAELYGDGLYLGQLLNYTEGMQACGSWNWQRYCGDPLTVAHYDSYEIVIRTRWTQSNSLGVKWTGLELLDGGNVLPTATETAVPEVTATPSPFPTATPTGEPTMTPTANTGRWCTDHPEWPGC